MRRAMLLAVFAAAGLLLFGTLTTRGFYAQGLRQWLGVPAVLLALAAYGALAVFALPPAQRRTPDALALGCALGLAGGAVYASEVILEYAVQPADNTAWGLAEFGLVFALFLIAGALTGWRTRRLQPAVAAGLWTALVSALIWYPVLLAVFYAFRGTAAQDAVFRAEGDFEDFRRSGLSDVRIFIMQDFLGAGFFHLALSPLLGMLLAAIGAVPALIVRRIRDRGGVQSAA
jgi:hypothetical protein